MDIIKIVKYIRLIVKILLVIPVIIEGIEVSIKKIKSEIDVEGLL